VMRDGWSDACSTWHQLGFRFLRNSDRLLQAGTLRRIQLSFLSKINRSSPGSTLLHYPAPSQSTGTSSSLTTTARPHEVGGAQGGAPLCATILDPEVLPTCRRSRMRPVPYRAWRTNNDQV
jgi:hypothetical protein